MEGQETEKKFHILRKKEGNSTIQVGAGNILINSILCTAKFLYFHRLSNIPPHSPFLLSFSRGHSITRRHPL